MDATTFSEVVQTVERLRGALDLLVIRGLRAAGADQVALLESHASELRGMGAEHLAVSLDRLVEETRDGNREAARALLHRVLEIDPDYRNARMVLQRMESMPDQPGAEPVRR